MDRDLVGLPIFKEIIGDDRVTPDLAYCIFCYISTAKIRKVSDENLEYKVSLDSLSPGIKQCPACKCIYLLKDPTV